ncbi:hypothetical protein ACVBE9_05480 [Eionea flava]
MMPKKIIIPAALLSITVIIAVYAIYSFNSRVSELAASYSVLEEESSRANIYDKTRCLSPVSIQDSLTSINRIHSHTLHRLLLSEKVKNTLSNSLNIMITQGIDCQLAAKEARLLTWPISPISAAQNSDFLATGENLQAFINDFNAFEEMIEKRKLLFSTSDDTSTLQLTTFNHLLKVLYLKNQQAQLHGNQLIIANELNTFTISSTFANEAAEHIQLSLNAIDSQIQEQLSMGTLWIKELQDATIDSKNITRLAQWFYWVDGLPNQCQQLTETLTPLLNTASISPIILNNNSNGSVLFNIETHLINDCPSAAQRLTTEINNTLSNEPFLLAARGVRSGLVSPTWLTIAESIESLAQLPFMVHSVLAEKSDSIFMCKDTTTDWDDQTAILMEKYTQEAIDFLAQHSVQKQAVSNTVKNSNFEERLAIKKLTILMNTLGNTAQKNLSITPSTNLAGKMSELSQNSERFSRFLTPFLTAINNTKALAINSSLTDLSACTINHTRNRFFSLSNIINEHSLLTMPVTKIDSTEEDNILRHFSNNEAFEQWWDKEQQTVASLIEYSEPYTVYLSTADQSRDTKNTQQWLFWQNTVREYQYYQNANDNNQVSQLYGLYKKTISLEKSQCDQLLSKNGTLAIADNNNLYAQRLKEYANHLNDFCNR